MTHATAAVMRPPFPAERGLDVYNNKLGMWVFLASEVMFFTALIGTYVILRFGAPGEWARRSTPGGKGGRTPWPCHLKRSSWVGKP